MAKKKFVLRIDEQVLAAVEKWAADDFRSVNGQLEWMISKCLKEANRLAAGQSEVQDQESLS
jgi:hypothetical protein